MPKNPHPSNSKLKTRKPKLKTNLYHNMSTFKYLFFLAFLAAQSACVLNPKPLDIDIPEPPQRLVVSAFAIPPQELAVTLTRTFSALLGEDSVDLNNPDVSSLVFVDSALVTLSYSGRTDTLFKLTPALFGSLTAEQRFNERYFLKVKDFTTGLEVSAETVLLPPVALDTVYPVVSILTGFEDTLHTFQYQFRDEPGTENYYVATYTNFNTLSQQISNPGQSLFNFNAQQFHVFSDKTSGDGQPISFKPDFAGTKGDTLAVALSNIPKGYYEFLAAYKRSGNLFSQLIGEPINLPTNVIGGYGYFAMIRPKIKLVILE